MKQKSSEQRRRTIWMGNILPAWNTDIIKSFFGNELSQPHITINCNARKGWKENDGSRVGFALLEFQSAEDADFVLRDYNGKNILNTSHTFNLKPNMYYSEDSLSAMYMNKNDSFDKDFTEISYKKLESLESPSLEEQLEPLTISQLRYRLSELNYNLSALEECAQKSGGRIAKKKLLIDILCFQHRNNPTLFPRIIVHMSGKMIPENLLTPLRSCLTNLTWQVKKRKLQASEYLVLGVAAEGAPFRVPPLYDALWGLAAAVISFMSPGFEYSSVAVTKNLVGSPHVDRNDKTHQFTFSLGDFTGGGELCVEADASTVCVVNTKERLVAVDGQRPHWVAPYSGLRYSLVYYRVTGSPMPPEQAVVV